MKQKDWVHDLTPERGEALPGCKIVGAQSLKDLNKQNQGQVRDGKRGIYNISMVNTAKQLGASISENSGIVRASFKEERTAKDFISKLNEVGNLSWEISGSVVMWVEGD